MSLEDGKTVIKFTYTVAKGDNGVITYGVKNVCDIAGNITDANIGNNTVTQATPYVTNLTYTTDGNNVDGIQYLKAGKKITFTVEYNEAISNIDTSKKIKIKIGSDEKEASYSSTSGNSIIYTYTIVDENGNLTDINVPENICKDRVGHNSPSYSKNIETPDVMADTIAPEYELHIVNGDFMISGIFGIGKTITARVHSVSGEVLNKSTTNKVKFGTSGTEHEVTEITEGSPAWTTMRDYTYTIQAGDNDVLIFKSDLEDRAGNKAVVRGGARECVNYDCYADTVKPVATIEPQAKTYSNNSTNTYTIKLSDNGDHFERISGRSTTEDRLWNETHGIEMSTFTLDDIVVSNGTIISSTTDGKGNINGITVAAQANGNIVVYIKPNSINDCADPANTNDAVTNNSVIVDTEAPSITNISQEPIGWTNENVKYTCYAQDIEGEENLTYKITYGNNSFVLDEDVIKADDNKWVYGMNNGDTITFKVTDKAGNSSSRTVVVSNIDKGEPQIDKFEIDASTSNYSECNIKIKAHDVGDSGINQVTVNGENIKLNSDGTYTYRTNKNGTYILEVADKAGNSAQSTVKVENIDTNKPKLSVRVEKNSYEGATLYIQATDEATDGGNASGIKDIKLNGTTLGGGNIISYSTDTNGEYTVVATDKAGNSETQVVTVDNIDDKGPTIYSLDFSETNWTNQNISLTVTAEDNISGISTFELKHEDETSSQTGNTFTDKIKENGDYTLLVTDGNRNITTQTFSINNIDKEAPELADLVYNEDTKKVTVSATDKLSGIANVEINGTKVTLDKDGKCEFIASKNGVYIATVTDNAGNSISKQLEVTNIKDYDDASIIFEKNGGNYILNTDSIAEVEEKVTVGNVSVSKIEYALTKEETEPTEYKDGGNTTTLNIKETVTEFGNYYLHIKVTDEFGHVSTATSNAYFVDDIPVTLDDSLTVKVVDDVKYIVLQKETTVEELMGLLTSRNFEIKIKNNDLSADETENVKTGDNIIVEGYSEEPQYKIVVKGDVNQDGKVTMRDIISLNLYRVGRRELDKGQYIAGDVNESGDINMRDIISINLYRVGKVEKL